MADLDESGNKLTIKLVYYGPAMSGKTTNLMHLHDVLRPELKGEIMTLETKNDRTLFFDLLPLGIRAPSGLLIKFKLYTVPGQVAHDSTRKAVLSRADGVVFVADSQQTQVINNAEAFGNLADNAARVGLNFDALPLVVQYNKRDLPGIVPEPEVLARWAKAPWPVVFSAAVAGQGVLETFHELLRRVYRAHNARYQLETAHRLDEDTFVTAASGKME